MNADEARAVLEALDLWEGEIESLHEHNPDLASAVVHLQAIVDGDE